MICRILNATGGILGTLKDFDASPFDKTIDGGLGEMVITTTLPFSSDSAVLGGNLIEISESDSSGTERRIYAGFVAQVIRETGKEVSIRCVGLHTALNLELYRDDDKANLTVDTGDIVPRTPNGIFADIITKFNSLHSRPFLKAVPGYSVDDVDDGTEPDLTDYVFERRTCLEAVIDLQKMSSDGQRWFVDQDGTCWFRAPSLGRPEHLIGPRSYSNLSLPNLLLTSGTGF
jgi:hypothetical protein